MSLPKEISPNPLIISSIEVRFISDLDEANVLGTFFPVFSKELEKLSTGKIPSKIRKVQEHLKYFPDYTLSNNKYSVSFSNKAILFENVGEYTFWDNYFDFVKKQLTKLFSLKIIKKIERIGVRYASILKQEENLNNILKHYPVFSINGFDEQLVLIRTDLKKNKNNLHLQIARNAKTELNGIVKNGLLIDIDASNSNIIEQDDEIVFKIIDELHSDEKSLFFELLTPTYLSKLNPKY